jgi:L-rhamnose mutarotase
LFRPLCHVQNRQLFFQAHRVFRLNPRLAARQEKPLEARMTESSNHKRIVACSASQYNVPFVIIPKTLIIDPTAMSDSLETVAFRMKLFPGKAEEYRRRHDSIWPELVEALHNAGVSDYRIFLDEETLCLFAILKRRPNHTMDKLPHTDVVRRWWAMMSDIMETKPDHSPIQQTLMPMFYME